MQSKPKMKGRLELRGAPSASEARAIIDARARQELRAPSPPTGLKGSGRAAEFESPHSDQDGYAARLHEAFGTCSSAFLNAEIERIVKVLSDAQGNVDVQSVDAAFAVLATQAPKDEIEAMLIIQMAITHALSMKRARFLHISKDIPTQDSNGLALHRLTKTFTSQIDALAKLRRGGEQKVTVEHVHVYPGGQAIVGNVTNSPGTGGITKKSEQPHAANDLPALAFEGYSALPCQDAVWEALPVADCPRQEALQDARRSGGIGRAKRRA